MGLRDSESESLRRAQIALAIVRAYPVRTPQHVPTAVRERPRGVYEAEFPPDGYRAFNIVPAQGKPGYVQFPAEWVTREFVRNLWRRLDAVDPQPSLKLHGASGSK